MPASKINVNGSIAINGSTTIFSIVCSVNANPPANIIWLHKIDGIVEKLTNTSRTSITHQFTSDNIMAPISLSNLTISATESNDYVCMANNTIGDAVHTTSLNFSLVKTGQCNYICTYKGNECLVEGTYCSIISYVFYFIYNNSIGQSTEVLGFITMPRDQRVMDGKSVEFQCSACSSTLNKPTIISWTFTRKGSMQSEVISENSTLDNVDIILGENSLSLIITSVNWTYEGAYECIISTDDSQIDAKAYLSVLSKLHGIT